MKLIREPSTPDGTRGTWYDDDSSRLCYTIELPWLQNEPDKSCIPSGVYEFVKYLSPKHGFDVWLAQDVPGRSDIEIHPANLASELLGCIGTGDTLGDIDGRIAVLNSQVTFRMLMSKLPDSFYLTII
jgi:hypothetical protein